MGISLVLQSFMIANFPQLCDSNMIAWLFTLMMSICAALNTSSVMTAGHVERRPPRDGLISSMVQFNTYIIN